MIAAIQINATAASLGVTLFGTGLVTLLIAVRDPGQFVTKLFEQHRDWRGGFWSVSKNPVQFRYWCGELGIWLLLGGVVTIVAAV